MRVFVTVAIYFALCGCSSTAYPTPEQLAQSPARYDEQHVSTCGEVFLGGGKCTLQTNSMEIWISSETKLCTAPATTSIQASVSGLFSVVGPDNTLVLRKARVEPITGNCSQSST